MIIFTLECESGNVYINNNNNNNDYNTTINKPDMTMKLTSIILFSSW